MGAAAFLFIAFAALVLWLRYSALPDVDRYRATIVDSIERASGMAVSVRAIRGGWGGLRPVLSLEGMAIRDRAGRAAFQLERAEVSLSWWALLVGQVRFHDVDLYRPDLVLRRGADGLIYLADKPLNAAGETDDGAFTEWLLAQPRLGIHDATLTWRDDFLGAAEVRLTGVEVAVTRGLGRHRAALSAIPPAVLARRIDLRADVALTRDAHRWRAAGQVYAEGLQADLARLREHLPIPESLRSGLGSVRLWIAFGPEGVTEATGDVTVRDARARLADDALPLELASLSGRATYRADAKGFQLATEGLRFRLRSGVEARPGAFSIARSAPAGKPARVEVHADGIDLKIAAALLDCFPVPREIKAQAQRFAPRGRIADARFSWTEDGARAYSVKGRFEDLAVNAVDSIPGMSGITGSIEGSEAGGELRIDSKKVGFEAANLFRQPLAFDALEARARWKPADGGLEVTIVEARLANADLEATVAGTWRSIAEANRATPGHVDLKGRFTRGVVGRAATYLPNRLEGTRNWLETALQSGDITRASFELRGDLWEFPFGKGSQGHFLFEADVRDARLRYHPAWPSIDAIEGKVRFENRRMDITTSRAAIFTSRVRSASAVIADLGERPPLLVIDGEIETSGAESVRFLKESPLVNGPGAFTRAVSIEGTARLKLHLDYPLWGTEPLRVAGEYQFTGATATVGRNLAMRDIRGRLAFTERSVRAPDLAGTMFGRPATLSLATEDGRVVTFIDAAVDAAALADFVPPPIAARLVGSAAWKARISAGPQGMDIGVSSDLKGLASRLPEPLGKGAEESRALAIRIVNPGTDAELVIAALAGGVHWRSTRTYAGDAARWHVAIKSGAPVTGEPVREGLWLYGEPAFLDADAWMEVFAGPAAVPAPAAVAVPPPAIPVPAGDSGFTLRGVGLTTARLRYLGREFPKMSMRLERTGPVWQGTLDSPAVAGSVEWNASGKGKAVARLSRLAIGAQVSTSRPEEAPHPDEDLPALDVVAERFEFRGRELGKLELRADYEGDDWRIAQLDITNGHAKWRSSGAWRRTSAGSLTTLAVRLDAESLNLLMGQFGYGDYVTRGTGKLEGTLAWPGNPAEFSTSILSGTLRVEANRGQFAKLEPGAGKLLGLLSLQSLPRRAMFDFRDVFSDGFAFESIAGNVKIARGVMITEEFDISGPSAFVSLSGEVSLPRETQVLTMRVVPEVGEGMALAATVFGTPVLGLSTLLLSKLLRNPLGKVVSYDYQVTGSWDNPVVTKISAPPPSPPTPAKAAAAAEAKK